MEQKLPDDIREVLLKCAKRWMLTNYVGGLKQLDAWSEHFAYLTSIHSYDLPGSTAKNLRRLAKLTADGVLLEERRYVHGTGTRRFKPRPDVLDQIGFEAQRYWEAIGYRVGEKMPEITQPAPKEAP